MAGKTSKGTAAATSRRTKKPRILVLGHVDTPLADAGAEAITMSYHDDRAPEAAAHENIDALLLTGGSDISPSIYGEAPHRATQYPDEQRDLVELLTLEAAMARGIPIMGICRGMQMINAAFGGTLHQHVPAVAGFHNFHNGNRHRVRAARGSRLAKALGTSDQWALSLHHQAVKDIAPGFVATAWANDGLVEAIESTEGWVLGVQFHPEMTTSQPEMQRIFNRFALAAARNAGLPDPRPRQRRPLPARRREPTVPTRDTTLDRLAREWDAALVRDGVGYGPDDDEGWAKPTATGPTHGRLTKRDRRGDPTVSSYWMCFRCGLRFDEREDHLDHMLILHDVDLRSSVGAK